MVRTYGARTSGEHAKPRSRRGRSAQHYMTNIATLDTCVLWFPVTYHVAVITAKSRYLLFLGNFRHFVVKRQPPPPQLGLINLLPL